MTHGELIEHFAAVPDLSGIRDTRQFADLAESLSGDPAIYVTLMSDFLRPLNGRFERLYEQPLYLEFERLEDILRELYYFDWRTFEAFLFQCDLALEAGGSPDLGMNQTAPLACVLPPQGRGFKSDDEYLRRVERYLAAPAMRHNAREIRRRILQRSPDLVPAPDLFPAT